MTRFCFKFGFPKLTLNKHRIKLFFEVKAQNKTIEVIVFFTASDTHPPIRFFGLTYLP